MRSKKAQLLVTAMVVILLFSLAPPELPDQSPATTHEELTPPSNAYLEYADPDPFNLTNDYQKIWEPNNIRGSTHAIATSPSKDLVAVAGGYLSDSEVHIYRWNEAYREYVHVWNTGDGLFGGDLLDIEIMDSDNNGVFEIVVGCADGKIYVLEALGEETGALYGAHNYFELVWDSGLIMGRQVWDITVDDIDYDSHTEIIAANWDHKVYVFDFVDHSAWPYCSDHWLDFELVWTSEDIISDRVNAVAVGDNDADGRKEIIAGSQNGTVYVFEAIPCLKHVYNLWWTSGDSIYRPVNALAYAADSDGDEFGEFVVSAYGLGTYLFHFVNDTQDFLQVKITKGFDSWERGVVDTAGVYTGYEADYYADKKTYGWEEQGVYEVDIASVSYPWNTTFLGGASALGGPPDNAHTMIDSDEMYQLFNIWEFEVGTKPWQAAYLFDIDFDYDGVAYIVDGSNDKVMKLSPNGDFISAFGQNGSDPGQFDFPAGVALSHDGFVYVADSYNHRIQKFTMDGDFVTMWGEEGTEDGMFDTPVGVDVDMDGNVYVADQLNSRIQKFSAEGDFLMSMGTNGSADGEFYLVVDVAVDSMNNVYGVDYWNHRIVKFDSEGNFLFAVGSEGSGEGYFDNPSSIAVDEHDNFYVAEFDNDRVQKYTSGGKWLTYWGGYGSAPGEFDAPRGIAVSPNGALHVVDVVNYRVQVFNQERYWLHGTIGSRGNETGELDQPLDTAIGPDGLLYVSDAYNDRVNVYERDGDFLFSFSVPGEIPDTTASPYGIEVDEDGFIYVTTSDEDNIKKFDSSGNLVATFNETGMFINPGGIVSDRDGKLFVSDTDADKILVLAYNGTLITTFGGSGSGPGQFDLPLGIDYHDGKLYVADYANNRIQWFFPNGTVIAELTGSFTLPWWVSVNHDGSMYISTWWSAEVYRYSPYGDLLGVLDDEVHNYVSSASIAGCFGASFDDQGIMYIANSLTDTVLKIEAQFLLSNIAEAVVDIGRWEEFGGDGTDISDLFLYFSSTSDPDFDYLELSISNDSETFYPIASDQSQVATGNLPGYGPVDLTLTNVDDALREADWTDYRYLRIGVKGDELYYIDAIYGRIARPIDTVLTLSTGYVNTTPSGDSYKEFIAGTSDGQIIAISGSGGILWQSESDTPRFSLDKGIRDIEQLKDQGRMPTWEYDEVFVDESYIVGLGFGSFTRIVDYELVDITGGSALDLVLIIELGSALEMIVLRNDGTDTSPSWTYFANYFINFAHPGIGALGGYQRASVTFADLNQDGEPDFVLSGYVWADDHYEFDMRYFERSLSDYEWYEETNQLTAPMTIATNGNFTPKVSFYDMDYDGDLDMTLSDDRLYYFENIGTTSSFFWFEDPDFYREVNNMMKGGIPGKVAFHDMDYDFDIDLSISFSAKNITDEGPDTTNALLMYVENTGTWVTPDWERRRSIYEPDFRGSDIAPGAGNCSPTLVDMDGDGILDLISYNAEGVHRYFGVLSHDTFMVATYPLIHMVEVQKTGTLYDYYGYEAYDSWDNHEIMDRWTLTVAFGDADDDGKEDVVVGSFDNNIITFEQVANNTYRRAWRSPDQTIVPTIGSTTLPYWSDMEDIFIDDQDNDGKKELITAGGGNIRIFENVENDLFELVWSSPPIVVSGGIFTHLEKGNLQPVDVLAAGNDMDADGQKEIIAGAGSYLLVYEHLGENEYNLTWYYKFTVIEGGVPVIEDIESHDTDKNGFKEMIVAVTDTAYDAAGVPSPYIGQVVIFENEMNADGEHVNDSYTLKFASGVGGEFQLSAAYSLALGDHDDNGLPEIFVGTADDIQVVQYGADDDYHIEKILPTYQPNAALAAGNTDGDSYMEVVAGSGSFLLVFEQNATFPATDHHYDLVYNSTQLAEVVTDLELGDSNHNGKMEIIATALKGYLYSFEWLSNGTVEEEEESFFFSTAGNSPVLQQDDEGSRQLHAVVRYPGADGFLTEFRKLGVS